MVEQRTENPCDDSSNLSLDINIHYMKRLLYLIAMIIALCIGLTGRFLYYNGWFILIIIFGDIYLRLSKNSKFKGFYNTEILSVQSLSEIKKIYKKNNCSSKKLKKNIAKKLSVKN